MPPAVVDAINSHRAALLAREEAAMQAQARAWLQVEQAIQAQVDALALELASQPGTATMGQLVRSRRYQALLQQTRDELRKYEDFIEPRIRDGQSDMITLALQHSQQAVNAVATEAQVVVPFNRLPVSAVNSMVGLAGDGSPLRAVLQDASRVGPDAMAQELVNGIALGRNPIAVARRAIRMGLGQSFTRMQTIARTEMLRTYRVTTQTAYQNSNVVVGYRRLSARDDRVCPGCLMADGRTYPLGTTFESHVNCVVGGTLVSSPTVLATSKRWFDGYVIEIRTIDGHVLTVTENHPVLTDQGWIAAHLLQVGDNVISSRNSERTVSLFDPNNHSRPAIIEDVIESFAGTGGMIPVSVPGSPIDFHGDGSDGNVDIVYAYGSLQDWRQSTIDQPLSKQTLCSSCMGLRSFLTESAFRQISIGASFAPNSLVGGKGIGGSLLGRSGRLQQPIGFGLVTNSDSRFYEAPTDYTSTDTIGIGKGFFGFSGDVPDGNLIARQLEESLLIDSSLSQMAKQRSVSDAIAGANGGWSISGDVVSDRIVNLTRRQFSGHVYNLQTSTGWYIAEGIITHNCRCSLVPILRNVPPVQFQTGQEWFREQPEATQRRILGAGRYEAWRNRGATLDDMVTVVPNDTWGDAIVPTLVRNLP